MNIQVFKLRTKDGVITGRVSGDTVIVEREGELIGSFPKEKLEELIEDMYATVTNTMLPSILEIRFRDEKNKKM